jgi:hypothetical protein
MSFKSLAHFSWRAAAVVVRLRISYGAHLYVWRLSTAPLLCHFAALLRCSVAARRTADCSALSKARSLYVTRCRSDALLFFCWSALPQQCAAALPLCCAATYSFAVLPYCCMLCEALMC